MRAIQKPVSVSIFQLSKIRTSLQKYCGKEVVVTTNGNLSKNNQPIQGVFISVSTNLFSVKMHLGKNGTIIKSFSINDVAINKISITEIEP